MRLTLGLCSLLAAGALVGLVRHADATGHALAGRVATAKGPSGPVLTIRWLNGNGPGRLTRVDPLTLRPRTRALTTPALRSWSFSPDLTRVVLAPNELPELRFVDVRSMRPAGRMQVADRGVVESAAWVRGDRLLVLLNDSPCCGGDESLVVVDPTTRKVLRRQPLQDHVGWPVRSKDGLVMLILREGAIGAARLAVVDSEGNLRVVTIDRVEQGFIRDETTDDPVATQRSPGLAVDVDGNRAFLVGAGEPVAEVDLGSLSVSYHELSQPVSLLGRLRDWLEPRAEAKGSEGPSREAKWIGDGLVAVVGSDGHVTRDSAGRPTPTWTPAGLSIIDTRTWSVRRLADRVDWMVTAPGLVLGTELVGDRSKQAPRSKLRAFDLAGEQRWSSDSASGYSLAAEGPYLYRSGPRAVDVMDAASGRVLRTVRGTNVWILSPSSQLD